MKELKTMYRAVARYMALGVPIEKICAALSLNLESVKRVAGDELFKAEVRRVEAELEERILEDAASDPVVAELKMAGKIAAARLVQEVENFDKESGGSAATRIKAAESILDRIGYSQPVSSNGPSLIFVELSPEKLAAVQKKATPAKNENIPTPVPAG